MATPELLLPAGTLQNMHYAFAYGADARSEERRVGKECRL